jgi:hypothetical protein
MAKSIDKQQEQLMDDFDELLGKIVKDKSAVYDEDGAPRASVLNVIRSRLKDLGAVRRAEPGTAQHGLLKNVLDSDVIAQIGDLDIPNVDIESDDAATA